MIADKIRVCPTCKAKHDSVTGLANDNDKFKEGDIVVCFNCGEVMQYDQNLDFMILPTGG